MSAPNASVFTDGYFYVNNGVAAGAFGLGNDTTGDGTAATPWLTLAQALQEIYDVQPVLDTHLEGRLLSQTSETNDYGYPLLSTTNSPATTWAVAHLILQGWNKTWADQDDPDKWATLLGTEKPEISIGQSGVHNTTHITFSGVKSSNDYFFNNSSATNIVPDIDQHISFYACVMTKGSRINIGTGVGSTSGYNATRVHACYFDDKPLQRAEGGISTRLYASNCYVNAVTISEAVICQRQTGGFQEKGVLPVSCYFRLANSGQDMYRNVGATDVNNNYGIECNHYEMAGGSFGVNPSGVEIATYTAYRAAKTLQDLYSGNGGSVSVSAADPTPVAGSRLHDKGGRYEFETVDKTGRELHLKDILGYYYGDAKEPITLASLNMANSAVSFNIQDAQFTQRSVGIVQTLALRVAPAPVFRWPLGVGPIDTPYIVYEISQDRDASGTGHILIRQFSDSSGDTLISKADSQPITIDATNNKIDIDEGGGNLVATVASGDYDTAGLLAAVKTALDTAGADVYTVTRNATTESVNIASDGTYSMDNATGPSTATSCAVKVLGFVLDMITASSQDAENGIGENFYVNLAWSSSTDYDGVSDPATDGAWNDIGTGKADDGGTPLVDGFDLSSGSPVYVRVDYKTHSDPVQGTFFKAAIQNGNLRTARIA